MKTKTERRPRRKGKLSRTRGSRQAAVELAAIRIPPDMFSLRCPICLNYICSAVTTVCGHTYCEPCIGDYILYFKRCLCCRRKLRSGKDLGKSKTVDALVESHLATLSPAQHEQFNKRREDHKRALEVRTVKEFCVGMEIDVRSPELVWCEGLVKKIVYKGEHSKRMIIVKYKNMSSVFNEEISEGSERLASAGFYTRNPDLPRLHVDGFGQRVVMVLGKPVDYAFVDGGEGRGKKCLAESDSSYADSPSDSG